MKRNEFNRREVLKLAGMISGLSLLDIKNSENIIDLLEKTRTYINRGQLTSYSTDLYMYEQVFYRLGLNMEFLYIESQKNPINTCQTLEELTSIPNLIEEYEYFNLVIPRLKNPLSLVKSTTDPASSPHFFIAPDTADFNRALGYNYEDWNYIGREVTLLTEGKYNKKGDYIDDPTITKAYIFDVLAEEHRKYRKEDTFFCDTNPAAYREIMGLKYDNKTETFKSFNDEVINALPYTYLYFNPRQLDV